jgi:hypothetical protein
VSGRSWYVGLPCRRCGRKVVVTENTGYFCQPVQGRKQGKPWAEHGGCRRKAGRK